MGLLIAESTGPPNRPFSFPFSAPFVPADVVCVQAGGLRLATGVGEALFAREDDHDGEYWVRPVQATAVGADDPRVLYQPVEPWRRKRTYYRIAQGLSPAQQALDAAGNR